MNAALTKKALLQAIACAMAINLAAHGAANGADGPVAKPPTNTMKIRLTINGKAISATLLANGAAKDFLSLLPLTLSLDDYAATEKIAYLPRKLSTAGAPAGSHPSVGDIAYYAPWGNLAIFYKDAPYANGLIPLGRIDSGIEALSVSGKLKVTIGPGEK